MLCDPGPMNVSPRQGIPLRPDPLAVAAEHRRSYVRAATACVLGEIQKTSAPEILRNAWPQDRGAETILRGATSPLKLADYPAPTAVGELMRLAPRSGASRLFELAAVRVDLRDFSSIINIPIVASWSAAVFVGEGLPIAVRQGAFAAMTLGPVRKLALIGALTDELKEASANTAEIVIGHVLEVTIGRGLDAILFSASAASAVAPAGLLNGVSPVLATTGGGRTALVSDLRNLVAAISTAGIDAGTVVFVCSEPLALAITAEVLDFPYRLIGTNAVPAGTVIAIATAGLAVAGSGLPVTETTNQGDVHMEDSAPLAISTPGTPPTVAAPTRSFFQTSSFGLRCIARITWVAAPGAVAYVEDTTW